MRKAILALAVAVVSLIAGPNAFAAGPSIIGGHDATETYSFHAALSNGCGGSLVAAQWIVTAHHCGKANSARIGSNSKNSGGESVRIDKVVDKQGTDLTMMHLSAPAKSKPVPMAKSNPQSGSTARLIGYGCTSWPRCTYPTTLQEIDLKVLPSSNCRDGGGIDGDVCISGDATHSACHGDSGGPALVGSSGNWTLVGETHGPGDNGGECATSTLYTGIAQYQDWIGQQINSQLLHQS